MKTWTDGEVLILLENYNAVSNATLLKMLPQKSKQGIYKKAYKMGLRKSPEIEFLNRSESKRGENSPNLKGGTKKNKHGYRLLLRPGHHRADTSGYVMEHIVVWEEETGAMLPDNCCIHHLNGIKDDNRIENLCAMLQSAHTVYHNTGTKKSDETKALLSAKAKERFADKRNHPAYKQINMEQFGKRIQAGSSIKDICAEFGIGKTTYYKKRSELNNA